MPDDTQVNLKQTIAELRRELGARTTERDGALAREAAMAEVLGVINSSPGNLASVFDAILDKAHTLCGATFGGLLIREGEQYQLAAVRAELHVTELWQGLGPYRPAEGAPLMRLRAGERIVHLADVQAAGTYENSLAMQRLIEAGGIRTLLVVPLRKDGLLLGAITAYRQEVRLFTDKEIALLQNFAAQAVIAIENARLLTETREALEQQTATAEVLQVINSSPGDIAPFFDAMLEKAMRLCEAAFGILSTYDGESLRAVASSGVPAAADEFFRKPIKLPPASVTARLVRGEAFVQVADIAEDDGYRSDNPLRVALVDLGGARTALAIALHKDDTFLGVLWFYRQEVRPFTDKQIALLQNFAAQAVIAMENARLLTETREALEQQTATAEVLQVINSSPGDLAPVFDAML
jgi:GAF domain-containing protein